LFEAPPISEAVVRRRKSGRVWSSAPHLRWEAGGKELAMYRRRNVTAQRRAARDPPAASRSPVGPDRIRRPARPVSRFLRAFDRLSGSNTSHPGGPMRALAALALLSVIAVLLLPPAAAAQGIISALSVSPSVVSG